MSVLNERKSVIAVIGLGCVGYPLALAFGAHWLAIGFDIKVLRRIVRNRGKIHPYSTKVRKGIFAMEVEDHYAMLLGVNSP